MLFGKPRFKSVNELKFYLLKAKRGSEDKITNNTNIEITNMPPCNDSLREHVRSQLPSCDLETGTCNKTRCAKSINSSWMLFLKDDVLESLWMSGKHFHNK